MRLRVSLSITISTSRRGTTSAPSIQSANSPTAQDLSAVIPQHRSPVRSPGIYSDLV